MTRTAGMAFVPTQVPGSSLVPFHRRPSPLPSPTPSPTNAAPSATALDKRSLASLARRRNFTTHALRAFLRAKELLMLSMGVILGEWRESRDPVSGAFAEHCQAELKLAELSSSNAILHQRLRCIPPSRRPAYSPEDRFSIVKHITTFQLTHETAAAQFLVDRKTIGRWVREARSEPEKNTIGSILKASPPLRSYADGTRQLVAMLDAMKIGGSLRIAQTLMREGIKVSREFVRTVRKAPVRLQPAPDPAPFFDRASNKEAAVRAKEPNHVWMTDITNIPTLFGVWILRLVVVLDVYSRFPLAFRVYSSQPTSEEVAALVQEAADKHGKPKHFITDQGPEFKKGTAFRKKLDQLGVKHRAGAIGQSGSIAIIERFWRTVKDMVDARFLPPLSPSHLEKKVTVALDYYARLRPHQGLHAATPAEMYFQQVPAASRAIRPPRAHSREPAAAVDPPFVVAFADDQRRLPYLVPREKAA